MDCAKGLEGSVASLPDVEKAELSFFDGILTVSGDVSEDDVRKMITRLGYGVAADEPEANAPAAEPNAVRVSVECFD